MEAIWNSGIAIIIWLQSMGPWLAGPMQLFSLFGSEFFVLILIPVLYWCVDTGFAVRIGLIVLFSSAINESLKLLFHAPRPYWISTRLKAYSSEATFGIPSGHSLTSTVLFGTAAPRIKRPWAWPLALLIIFLVGLSRMFLGVHFPTDVLAGWILGALILWLSSTCWEPLSAWVKTKALASQIGLAFGLSLLLLLFGVLTYLPLSGWTIPAEWQNNSQQAGMGVLLAPVSLDNIIASAAALFGMLAGLAWITQHGGFAAGGSLGQKALRLLLGLVGVLVFYLLLDLVFPKGATLLPYALRYLRYALVGAWISAGAPWAFRKLNLAQGSQA